MTFQQNQQFPNQPPFQPNQFTPQAPPFIPNQNSPFPAQPPIPPGQKNITIHPNKPKTFGQKTSSSNGLFIIILIVLNLLQTGFIVYENILPYLGIEVASLFPTNEPNENANLSQTEISPSPTPIVADTDDYSSYLNAFSDNQYKIEPEGNLSIQKENEYEDSEGIVQTSKTTFSIDYANKQIFVSEGVFALYKNNENFEYFEPDGSYLRINHENNEFIKVSPNTPEYEKLRSFLGIFDDSISLTNSIYVTNDPLFKIYEHLSSNPTEINQIGDNEFTTELVFSHFDPLAEKTIEINLNCIFSFNPSTFLIDKIIVSSVEDDIESEFLYNFSISEELNTYREISQDYQNITNQALRIEN